jgi:serine/threonine protein kinase
MKVLKKYRLFKTNQIYHTKTEREILEKINHPFIVKLHFAFQTDEKLYLVTEFMQGGELFFHLKKEKIFNEEKVKAYVSEIILAIEHLHKNKIIYRDLKPENILLDIDGHIKLTDFGLSKFFTISNSNYNNTSLVDNSITSNDNDNISNYSDKAFTLCGTPEYLAPEILIGKGYDKSVDWWSLGVLIHEMLIGASPFKRRRERLDLSYYTPVIISKKISENAKDLILNLLKHEPNERLSDSREIKNHEFFKDVDWERVLMRECKPQFVPKVYLKSEEDVCLFDKNFTMASLSDDEYKGEKFTENQKNLKNEEIFKKFEKNKIRKIKDDFENFSFTREDINNVSKDGGDVENTCNL